MSKSIKPSSEFSQSDTWDYEKGIAFSERLEKDFRFLVSYFSYTFKPKNMADLETRYREAELQVREAQMKQGTIKPSSSDMCTKESELTLIAMRLSGELDRLTSCADKIEERLNSLMTMPAAQMLAEDPKDKRDISYTGSMWTYIERLTKTIDRIERCRKHLQEII